MTIHQMLLGAGQKLPYVEFLGVSQSGATIARTVTANGVLISKNRVIVGVTSREQDGAGAGSTMTFNGVAGTDVYAPAISDPYRMQRVTDTTNANISVSNTSVGSVLAVWAVHYPTNTTPIVVSGTGSTLSITTAAGSLPKPGCGIIAARSRNTFSGSATTTIVGGGTDSVVTDSSNIIGGGNHATVTGHALFKTAGSKQGVANSPVTAFSAGDVVMAMWY